MDTFAIGVISGLVVAFLLWLAKWQSPMIRSLFDVESRRQAKQLTGIWDAQELFIDGTEDTFRMTLECKGGQVKGRHDCLTGHDAATAYDIVGTYKDLILTFHWKPIDIESLESGTVTVRLIKDHELEGYGLYVEPDDGKVYTSTFRASKIS